MEGTWEVVGVYVGEKKGGLGVPDASVPVWGVYMKPKGTTDDDNYIFKTN